MAALSKRDIEMIFRAETDKASRPINDLVKDVAKLRVALKEQTDQAEKGEGSLEALAGTVRDLKKAQDELGTARSLLTQLNSQQKALEVAGQKAGEAREKYEQLQKQVDGADKPTKRLTNSLEAAGRAAAASAEGEAKLQAQVAETRAEVEAIIGPIENFQESFRQIAVTSKEVARGLALSGEAADTFKTKAAQAAAEGAKLASDSSFQQSGQASGLLQSQIDYISQFENRVELLAAAKRELVAQDAGFQKALEAQEAKVGADNVRRITAAFEDAALAEQRLEQATSFRQIAAQAAAAANDVGRFASTFDSSGAAASTFAARIQAIVQPTRVAIQSLDDLEAKTLQAQEALSSKSKRISFYQDALNDIEATNAALVRLATVTQEYATQEARVSAAQNGFDKARVDVLEFANAIKAAEAPTEQMVAQLRNAETALDASGRSLQIEVTKLDQLGVAAKAAGIDINNLAGTEERLESTSKRAAAATSGLSAKMKGGPGGKSLFGLNPYELQNLGYQVQDVVSSLASGINPMQVFAQQGFQITSIFPGLLTAIAANIPVIAAFGVALGVAVGVMREAVAQIDDLKNFESVAAGLGNGSRITAEQATEGAKQLRDFGVSADDARKAVTTFMKEGLDPKAFEDWNVAVVNGAKYMKMDVSEAAETMAKAFTRGGAEVLALDDKVHFLSDTQRDQIAASIDQANETEEVTKAYNTFFNKASQTADAQNGPWSQATSALRGAWRDMLGTLADTGIIDGVINVVSNAIKGLAVLINLARQFNDKMKANTPQSIGEFFTGIPKSRQDNRTGGQLFDDAIKQTQGQLARATAAGRQQTFGGGIAGGSQGQQREQEEDDKKRRKDAAAAAKRDAAKAAREREAAANRAAAEAKRLREQIEREGEQIDNSLDRMTSQALKQQTGSIANLLQNAAMSVDKEYAPLRKKLDDFAALTNGKGTIGGKSISQVREQMAINQQILVQQKQAAVYEEQVNKLVEDRNRQLDQIEAKLKAGVISPAEAAKATVEVISKMNPLIQQAATDAAAFINTLKPSPELDALKTKVQGIADAANGLSSKKLTSDSLISNYQTAFAELDKLVQNRDANVAAQQALVNQGFISQKAGQDNIKAAFATTTPLIQTQVVALKQMLEALKGVIDPNLYAQWSAQLATINAQTAQVPTNMARIKSAGLEAFGQGMVSLFDTLAESVAGLLTGTQSLGDVLSNLGQAALQFAANFLKAIADVIIQILALQAVTMIAKALGVPVPPSFGIGGFHIGGDVGSYSGGVQTLNRKLSPSDFENIPRYHEGSPGVGLKKDEQLSILQKGEKVLTEEQQRREAARKPSGAGSTGIRQILAIGDEEIAGAMSGAAGDRVMFTWLQRNKPTVKQLLDS